METLREDGGPAAATLTSAKVVGDIARTSGSDMVLASELSVCDRTLCSDVRRVAPQPRLPVCGVSNCVPARNNHSLPLSLQSWDPQGVS